MELDRNLKTETVHRPTCSSKGRCAAGWNWARNKTLTEITAATRENPWLHLCRTCLPGTCQCRTCAATVMCGNEDHLRPVPAIARLSWPDGRFMPVAACTRCLRMQVLASIDGTHGELYPVLVMPVTMSARFSGFAAIEEVA